MIGYILIAAFVFVLVDTVCYFKADWPSRFDLVESLGKPRYNWPGAGIKAVLKHGWRPCAVILIGCVLGCAVTSADSVSVADVTQELRHNSALSLRNDVADDLAENLLAAQAAAPYTAFEPDSLQLSIDAVLKAINLEQSFGLTYCSDSTCPIVWAQSNIAIDDRVGITLNPPALNFGADSPVGTPEPPMISYVFAIAGVLSMILLLCPRRNRR